MKLNNTLWTIVIISIVAIVGLILIFKTESITGQTYNYGANFGPQGQRPLNVFDPLYSHEEEVIKRPYILSCCNINEILDAGLTDCPKTRAMFEEICLNDDLELDYIPCPSNSIKCFIPID